MSKRKERALVSKTGSLRRLAISAGMKVKGATVNRLGAGVALEVTSIIEHLCTKLVRELYLIAENDQRSTIKENMLRCALKVGNYNAIMSTGFKSCKTKASISKVIKQQIDHCLLLSRSGFSRMVRAKLSKYNTAERTFRIGTDVVELVQSFVEQCVISYMKDAVMIAEAGGKQTLTAPDIEAAFNIREGYYYA